MSQAARFDAQTVGRLTTVNEARRLDIELYDSEGGKLVVSLPVAKAVELGCMICDLSEHAPYLVGGVRTDRRQRLSGR